MRSKTLIAVGMALVLVLAGCGGGGAGSAPVAGSADGGGGGGDAGAEPQERTAAGGEAGEGGDSGEFSTRSRIRTGEVSLRVDSYDAARSTLRTLAANRGGYVADSAERTHSRENRTWTTGHVVLRVPSEEFGAVFTRIKERGRVVSASTSTTDVTDKLVDMEARLANLRAQRERLRALYAEANETEDVLRISEKLSSVQREIERLEARKRSLENRVAYATITVELREPAPEPAPEPEPEQWYETGVIAAFLESVSGALTVLRAIVVGAAYLAPYALLFGAPVAGAAYAVRARRKN